MAKAQYGTGLAAMRRIAPLGIAAERKGFCEAPGGRLLALSHKPSERQEECILVERSTHRITSLKGATRMRPIVFSKDGRELFVWCDRPYERLRGLTRKPPADTFIAVYCVGLRRFVRYFGASSESFEIEAAALSTDGKTLTVTTTDGDLGAWDTRSGHLHFRRSLSAENRRGVTPGLSSGGRYFMQVDYREGKERFQICKVVSSSSGGVLSQLRLPYDRPMDSVEKEYNGLFSADGRTAGVLCSSRQEWIFFDIHSRRRLWKLRGGSTERGNDLQMKFSPSGKYLFAGRPGSFEIRSTRTGAVLRRGTQLTSMSVMTWSCDDAVLYAFRDGDDFERGDVLWQYRFLGTARERREDAKVMKREATEKKRFAPPAAVCCRISQVRR